MKFVNLLKNLLVFASIFAGIVSATAGSDNLPMRTSPIPQTTKGVPHVQIGVEPDPEISAELLRRVSNLPGVEIRNTVISLPGAKGFWLNEDVALDRPDIIVGGREFAHMHPDGSLHASLSPELAARAVETGWAIRHPWADKRSGWEGFVMIYTPGSKDELEVTMQLVVESYNFVTGRNIASTGG